jgi:ribosomal-protein-alanine N-acetyltransferase
VSVRYALLEERDVAEVAAIDAASFTRKGSAADHVREELTRPWTKAWVARQDASGEALGYILAWHVADELHVLQVATAAKHRRKGVGRGLVDQALAFAAEAGVRLVLLEVRASNVAALALYRCVGFAEVNVRKRYYDDGEDAVEMQLSLSASEGGPNERGPSEGGPSEGPAGVLERER